MALSSDKYTYEVGNTERIPPVKGSTKIYRGAMVAVNSSGVAVPVTAATGLVCLGVADVQADNSGGSDGDIKVRVKPGIFPMKNSAGADELDWGDVGAVVYGVDDETVAKTSDTDSRSAVGTLWAMGKDGLPLVKFE